MTTRPADGAASPFNRRRMVVFPAPLRPMSATDSPAPIRSERSRTIASPRGEVTATFSSATEDAKRRERSTVSQPP